MASEKIFDLNEIGTLSPKSEHVGVVTKWRGFFAVTPEVLGRVMVIFGALGAVKLALLIDLRKHLQETHWRFNGDTMSTLGLFSFYALAVVLVYCLIQFGRQCQPAGVRTVRAANAVILTFAALLIFLSFHEGAKNYVYPVMTGTLKWWHLWSYLSLNLFFRPPFLAAWMFAYGIGYYVLARAGRERHVLILTAVFAGLYWVFCLQEFMVRKSDLWVTLLFGILSVVMFQTSRRPFRPVWLLLPAVWTLSMWYLFSLGELDLARLRPYFITLIGCLTVLFIAATLFAGRKGFMEPWLNLLPFAFVGILLLSNAHYPTAVNYNNLLGFVVKFPHYFLGELLVASILTLAAMLSLRLRSRGNFRWLDVVGVGMIFLAILDLRLTQIMGVRLGWDVLVFANDPKMMFRMAKPYLPALILALVVVCVVYHFAVRLIAGWLIRREPIVEKSGQHTAGWWLAGCFGMFAVLGTAIAKPDNAQGQSVFRLVQTSPVWKRAVNRTVPPEEFFRESQALGMPDWNGEGTVSKPRQRRDLNVLLILQESTYNQHLSLFSGEKDTQPRLSQYKDRMEIFPNFFANYASSIHARFATFTGLYPVRDFSRFTLDRVPVKSIFEVLSQNGYECSVFYSSFFDYTGFRSFLTSRQVAEMYDADTMPGAERSERVSWGLKEETTTQAIRQQIRKYAGAGKRFFLTYIPAAPHYPYDKIPTEFCKFQSDRYRDFTPFYLNALLYMDWNIASIIDELKEAGLLDETLVVITSDHGEMLGENNGPVGHGWRVTPKLANVPLIVMDPGQKGFRINEAVGSQVDVLPTVLDSLGLPVPPGELYQGQSLYSLATGSIRSIYLNSYDDFAVIAGREIRIGSRQAEDAGDSFQSARIHQMRNYDSITEFGETNKVAPPFSIHQFDNFQESLLRDYAFYRDSLATRRSSRVVGITP